ncbi:ELWxxDGT repeat protein, partial [Sulfurovum sp.]
MKKLIFKYSMALLFVLISTGCDVAITPLDQNEINPVVHITPAEGVNEITDENGVAITQLSNLPAQVTLDDIRLKLEGQGSENFRGLVTLVDETYLISVAPKEGFTVNVDTTFTFVATVYVLDSPSCEKNITIVMDGVNNKPVAMSQEITTGEDDSIGITLTAEDGDNDQLTYSIVSSATNGTIKLQGNIATYTPNTNYNGADTFTFRAYDGLEYSETESINITVLGTNDTPSITGFPATSVNVDSPYSFTPSATDVDMNDSLTFAISNPPIWATFDTATGELSGTPSNTDIGTTHDINISVTDSFGATVTLPLFDITVVDTTVNTNHAPTFTNTPQTTVNEDALYSYIPAVTDDDNDTLTFSINNKPAWATFDSVTGALTGTPSNADVGIYTDVNISVTDGTATASVTYDLTVQDTTAPVITLIGNATETIEVNTPYTDAGATASDNGDGNLTGSIVVTGTVDTTTPGSYTLSYDVNDTAGNSAAQVTRTVNVVTPIYLFSWCDDSNGTELWASDGTVGNTGIIKNISITGDSNPENFVEVNGIHFFSAYSESNGTELWKSEGTSGSTVMVKDINPGDQNASVYGLTDVNGTLFFAANDGINGYELWKSDGTTIGTVMVKNINTLGDSVPDQLIDVNGTLYFTADDGVHGRELWKSDGTDAGTELLIDLTADNTYFSDLGTVNGLLMFSADVSLFDFQLFSSDGSTVDQVGIFDSSLSGQKYFTRVNDTLFFSGYDQAHRRELWKSDGLTAQMVKDINTAYDSDDTLIVGYSEPEELTDVNGTLYFSAIEVDGENPRLWVSDGTDAGTVVVENADDITKKVDKPYNLIAVGGTLYFLRETGKHWRVWKANGNQATQIIEFEK